MQLLVYLEILNKLNIINYFNLLQILLTLRHSFLENLQCIHFISFSFTISANFIYILSKNYIKKFLLQGSTKIKLNNQLFYNYMNTNYSVFKITHI